MVSYTVRRLLYGVLTFFGTTLVVFVLVHSVPGYPIDFYVSQHMTHLSQAALDAIRHEHHLDQPLVTQYLYWLRGIVALDFGTSITDHRPVVDHVLEKLPQTLDRKSTRLNSSHLVI